MVGTPSNEIPPLSQLINPTLAALHDLGGSANSDEISDKVVADLGLSSDAATRTYKDSARPIVQRHLASARTILKSNGLIDNSERGVWALTGLGFKTKSVDASQARANYRKWRKERAANTEYDDGAEDEEDFEPDHAGSWRDSLLDHLRNMPPERFEILCQRLLRESGFIDVDVTGRPGDGGIDGNGIIRLGNLISFPVSFQCKRYSGNVPARDVRDFRGAMQGRAEKGLFITTGGFTTAAKEEATRDGAPPIDLIDGESLVDLLKELKLGVKVTQRTVEDVEVDAEFFDPV